MNDEQNRARFESLLLPLMNDAYNLARWLMRNQEIAEDMVQESYLRAFRFFASFHDGANCRSWFLRIVRNTCYTALGSSRIETEAGAAGLGSRGDRRPVSFAPGAAFKKSDRRSGERGHCGSAIEFREAVVLRELEGLSYKEISEISGVPIGTVMSRFARGRHQLHLMLVDRKQYDQL